jgi:hypothetical protein
MDRANPYLLSSSYSNRLKKAELLVPLIIYQYPLVRLLANEINW